MTDEPSTGSPFEAFWEDLLDDAEATATEYREDGWEVLTLTPGDVTAVYDAERPAGLSVLIPDPEFDTVRELVNDGDFDSVEVYRNTAGSVVFLLVIEQDTKAETAIMIPAYYNAVTDSALLETIEDIEELSLHVRPLAQDQGITFMHETHSLFTPDEDFETNSS